MHWCIYDISTLKLSAEWDHCTHTVNVMDFVMFAALNSTEICGFEIVLQAVVMDIFYGW